MKKICSLVIMLGVERIASPVNAGELESFVSKHNSQFLPCNCMKLDKGVLQVAFVHVYSFIVILTMQWTYIFCIG